MKRFPHSVPHACTSAPAHFSVVDKEYDVLVVSQFTLLGYMKRNRVSVLHLRPTQSPSPPHTHTSFLSPTSTWLCRQLLPRPCMTTCVLHWEQLTMLAACRRGRLGP